MARKSQDNYDRFFGRKRAEEARCLWEEKLAAFDGRMAEARVRMEVLRAFHEERRAEIAAILAQRMGGRPPTSSPGRDRKPPREDGGEPVPAMPRPRPKPLAGGAAAPLDPDRRKLAGAGTHKGAGRGRVPSDAESRQHL